MTIRMPRRISRPSNDPSTRSSCCLSRQALKKKLLADVPPQFPQRQYRKGALQSLRLELYLTFSGTSIGHTSLHVGHFTWMGIAQICQDVGAWMMPITAALVTKRQSQIRST